jgi:pyruvate/2-oxoglutarate dehydrogenase complex dihydrolipoamide acyltransferase (E2) component
VDVILPKWGMTMQEATILRWVRNEGDPVELGDVLVEVETDKVNASVEAPSTGVLTRRLADVGDIVRVGQPIGVIEPSAP